MIGTFVKETCVLYSLMECLHSCQIHREAPGILLFLTNPSRIWDCHGFPTTRSSTSALRAVLVLCNIFSGNIVFVPNRTSIEPYSPLIFYYPSCQSISRQDKLVWKKIIFLDFLAMWGSYRKQHRLQEQLIVLGITLM